MQQMSLHWLADPNSLSREQIKCIFQKRRETLFEYSISQIILFIGHDKKMSQVQPKTSASRSKHHTPFHRFIPQPRSDKNSTPILQFRIQSTADRSFPPY